MSRPETPKSNSGHIPDPSKPVSILTALADTPSIPIGVSEWLPRPIRRALTVFTQPSERDVLTTAGLGVLSGCLPNVWGRYGNGRSAPALFCCITAPAASGKGVLSHARRLGEEVERLFEEDYLKEKKAQAQEQQRASNAPPSTFELEATAAKAQAQPLGVDEKVGEENGGEKKTITFGLVGKALEEFLRFDAPGEKGPPRAAKRTLGPTKGEEEPFRRRLFISGDISSSALTQTMEGNGGFGTVFETEIDTVVKSQKQDWGGTSDTLRKAHAHETVSYLRVGGVAHIVARPTLAVVLAGTPNQVLKLIPSPEDGLFSRFLFYGFLPEDALSWKDVRPREDLPDPEEVLEEGAREVRRLWTVLEGRGETAPLGIRLEPHQWDRLNTKMELVKEHLFTRFGYAGASTAHRAGLHVFRLASVLGVWRAFEEGVDLATAQTVLVKDEVFNAALALGLAYAKHAAALMMAFPREASVREMTEEDARLYRSLPGEFGRAEAVRVGTDLGIAERTLDRRLTTWVKTGHLRRERKGMYRKVNRQ